MFHKSESIFILTLFLITFLIATGYDNMIGVMETDHTELTIVIDAGHGGNDPGKIGVDQTKEKDINLLLAQKLKVLFENKGICVILTRTSDNNLASENATSQKREDMEKRVEMIANANAACCISIHQNSYPDSSVSGAQVFYYATSAQSKLLASHVQSKLNELLSPKKPRTEKSNNDYFLLRKTPTPTIIAECGFLSNPTEAALLNDANYQDRIVRALYLGVCNYLSID